MNPLKPFANFPLEGSVFADFRSLQCGNLIELSYRWPSEWLIENLPDDSTQTPHYARQHELWKSTCFEAFIADPNGGTYSEINLSPMGGWNVYKFSSYRTPSPPVEDPGWTLVEMQYQPGNLIAKLAHSTPLPKNCKVGLTCILKLQQQSWYWALEHSASEPDFHQLKSFILERSIP